MQGVAGARKRGIDLRGFTLSYDGNVRSGLVLGMLMGGSSEDDLNLELVNTMLREVSHHLNEIYGEYPGYTALLRPAMRATWR